MAVIVRSLVVVVDIIPLAFIVVITLVIAVLLRIVVIPIVSGIIMILVVLTFTVGLVVIASFVYPNRFFCLWRRERKSNSGFNEKQER